MEPKKLDTTCLRPNCPDYPDLISRMGEKRSKVFNAHHGKIGTQWLNNVPCKNLG